MLRITVRDQPECLTLQLEGKLAGPWVRELESCWRSALASQRKPVVLFDLSGVTYIDAPGKEFLAARHSEGVVFRACGCSMKAVVAEITGTVAPDPGHFTGESWRN